MTLQKERICIYNAHHIASGCLKLFQSKLNTFEMFFLLEGCETQQPSDERPDYLFERRINIAQDIKRNPLVSFETGHRIIYLSLRGLV